jgi:hypothetical protein
MKKWLEYLVFELFSNRKCYRLGPWLVDQRRAWSMVDQPPCLAVELNRARPSDRSGPRWPAARWGKGGPHGDSILRCSKAWTTTRRRHTGGGTLARNGNVMGTVRTKRGRVGGLRIFTGGRAAFYRAKARRGRLGAFNGRR